MTWQTGCRCLVRLPLAARVGLGDKWRFSMQALDGVRRYSRLDCSFLLLLCLPPYANGLVGFANNSHTSGLAGSVVRTLAGGGAAGGSFGDSLGTGTSARFHRPAGVVVSSDGGQLFVADYSNHKIKIVNTATRAVTNLCGSRVAGSAYGSAASAQFNSPFPLALRSDATTLYVGDYIGNVIRTVVVATGAVATLAGSGSAGSVDGAAALASFAGPAGFALLNDATLYVSDHQGHKLRKVAISTGAVTTVAGVGGAGARDGAALTATFNQPMGLALSLSGATLYVADSSSHKVRSVAVGSTGAVSTVAGSGAALSVDGIGGAASFNAPLGLSLSHGASILYVSETSGYRVRAIELSTAAVTTVAGSGSAGAADGTSGTAQFDQPQHIAITPLDDVTERLSLKPQGSNPRPKPQSQTPDQ